PSARRGQSREGVPCSADAVDAGGRARAILDLEAVETLAAGGRVASARQTARRGLPTGGEEIRRENRWGARVRGHRRGPRIPAACKCSGKCRSLPKRRPITTFSLQ